MSIPVRIFGLLGWMIAGMVAAQGPVPKDSPQVVIPEGTAAPRFADREVIGVDELPPELIDKGDRLITRIIEGEYLLLAVRGLPQTYALSGTVPQLGPMGGTQTIPSGYESGFRVGFGWRLADSGADSVIRYTYYSNQSDTSVASPGIINPDPLALSIPPRNVYPTLTVPGLVAAVVSANAQSNVTFNLADFEIGQTIKPFDWSESLNLRVFAGARFANMSQNLTATYNGGDVDFDTVSRKITFNGGGLRLGGSIENSFSGNWGYRFTGSASLITGAFAGSQTEVANNAYILSITDKYVGIVPMTDLGLAVTYRHGGWNLSIGYEFQNWFNMLQGFNIVDDSNPAKLIREIGGIGFDGMALRAEYVW